MSVEISTYFDVMKRITDLGLNQPDTLAILPRNFDCATSMLWSDSTPARSEVSRSRGTRCL
jgi:hypothetical protein